MSYPLHRLPGGAPARTVQTEKGFWGLDLASGLPNRPFSRAWETENLLWKGEALGLRPGYRAVATLSGRINGIWDYEGDLLVHAGEGLFRLHPDGTAEDLGAVLRDAPSHGVVRTQQAVRRTCITPYSAQWLRKSVTERFFFINDGEHYLFYDGEYVRPVADPCWGENLFEVYKTGVNPEFYATVPFTAVAKLPGGGGDLDPRGDNRLSQFRCESFYVSSEAAVKAFKLHCLMQDYNKKMPPEVQIRDIEGVWRCVASIDIAGTGSRDSQLVTVKTPGLQAGKKFRCNDMDGVVEFDAGEYTFADDGMDNVRITYGVLKEKPEALTGATVQGLYGADGADDVLFLGGSAAAPGEDAFSDPGDFFSFHETATERLGDPATPVTGYCRLRDGRLAVLKDDPDGPTVFFRSHREVTVGQTQSGEPYRVEAYPSKTGAAVEGCRTPFSVGVAGNEPCFLSASGLYSVRSVSDELTNLNETQRRSLAIDPLLTSYSPEEARAVLWNRYYLLAFGRTVFLTDGARDGEGQFRFLKWTLAHGITAFGKVDGALYFGDGEGRIFLFGEGTDDAGTSFTGFWQTAPLEEGSGQRIRLRRLWTALSGGSVRAVLFRDGKPLELPACTAEGGETPQWSRLPTPPVTGSSLGVRLDLSGDDPALWGIRVLYEKAGMER